MRARLLLLAMYAWHLAVGATLWLGDVEGYYWLWSRELQASYLDHPPLDAWLLAGSTAIFGNTLFGVRFVPATLALITGWAMLRAAELLLGPSGGWRATVILCIVPGFVVVGVAASPDAPVVALAALVLLVCAAMYTRPSPLWPVLLGTLVGLGVLAKLSMVHFAIGLLWALLSEPKLRAQLRVWNLALGIALLLLCCAPVILWNAQHDFAMLRFHASRLDAPTWQNAAKLLFGQLGYYSPLIAIAAWRSLMRPHWLAKIALPTLLLMVPTIVLTRDAEPQWTALAYLPAILLLAETPQRFIKPSAYLLGGALLIAHVHMLTPLFVRLIPADVYKPRIDLVNDMEGWRDVGPVAQDLAHALGGNTVLAAGHYTLCGQLAFAAKDTPHVVCPTRRFDAFNFIPSRAEPPPHANVVFLADDRFTAGPEQSMRFASCTLSRHIETMRGDKVVRRFDLYSCRDYLGKPAT